MSAKGSKRKATGYRPTKGTMVNEALRASYRRFTKDKHTRRALDFFIRRPVNECAGGS